MKKSLDVFKAVCCVSAAVLLYITASKWSLGEGDIVLLCVSCVFAVSTCVLCFAVSSLEVRVKNLEDTLGIYVDKGYESDGTEKKICKKCSAEFDADYIVCPYCGEKNDIAGDNNNPYVTRVPAEKFETEDPDYMGTDNSDKPPVSANFDFTDIDENN